MIKIFDGSVFDIDCDMVVNTINCRGVMRAGIALEFALRYPKMYEAYVKDCQKGIVKIGKTYLYVCAGQKILNFPTKDDYKTPSQIKYLEDGLKFFVEHYKEYGAKSIAFPLLGCRNGGLDFEKEVKPLMLEYLNEIDLDVYICTNKSLIPNSLEFKMLDKAKNIDVKQLITMLCLDNITAEHLSENIQSVDRFWKLASAKMVGSIDNYMKIWNYFYLQIQGE